MTPDQRAAVNAALSANVRAKAYLAAGMIGSGQTEMEAAIAELRTALALPDEPHPEPVSGAVANAA